MTSQDTNKIFKPLNKRGPFVLMASGKRVFLLDPRPEEFDIHDIAWALGGINRWNGSMLRPINVAEHSVWVSHLVPEAIALTALLHDAMEPFVMDNSRPQKIAVPELIPYEAKMYTAIAQRWHLEDPLPSEVIDADNAMLSAEIAQNYIAKPNDFEWEGLPPAPDILLQGWNQTIAAHEFMKCFTDLGGKE